MKRVRMLVRLVVMIVKVPSDRLEVIYSLTERLLSPNGDKHHVELVDFLRGKEKSFRFRLVGDEMTTFIFVTVDGRNCHRLRVRKYLHGQVPYAKLRRVA